MSKMIKLLPNPLSRLFLFPQVQRWADYRSLFSLMAFTAVFLGVLYAQRGATVGYQVGE